MQDLFHDMSQQNSEIKMSGKNVCNDDLTGNSVKDGSKPNISKASDSSS